MKVTSLQISNFRSFVGMEKILLGQINVFIGANNVGKSSLLRALHLLQQGHGAALPDIRLGSDRANIEIGLEDISGVKPWGAMKDSVSGIVKIELNSSDRISGSVSLVLHAASASAPVTGVNPLPNMEPDHFIVPYLSKRKTTHYHEDVKFSNTMRIDTDMSYLSAKLSRLANPQFPEYQRYSDTCKAILGFVVTAVTSPGGQQPGVYLPDRQILPINLMGEGVPNIVSLLIELALSKGKLFLIEEPENDLHPQALKALLELITESSNSNQFVVSTHSNIVVRHLASIPNSRLYSINSEATEMPLRATVREIQPTVQARLEVLRDLGYSFSDFDLWDGWLILEESSAERIIRDYLIPWFAPKLARVRTVAAGGVSQVEPTFVDFDRMVRFTHLEEAYRNAAWVRVDGDDDGIKTISKLQNRYPTAHLDQFRCFSKGQFEHYYPIEFEGRVKDALGQPDKQVRREGKSRLLNDVRGWLDENEERGRQALELSAIEIIKDLQSIERQLFG
jgi:hypothetical protein